MSKSESPMFKLGFENRKAVLGAEHVEKSWAAADDFNRPMQELVTEYCWGAIWGRDDLPRKTRSLHQHRDAHRPQPAARAEGAR